MSSPALTAPSGAPAAALHAAPFYDSPPPVLDESLLSTSPLQFEMFIDIDLKKSFVDKRTGRIWVRGIASDNSADFQRDVVAMQNFKDALEILNRGWGKFNFEHHDETIGEVTSIAFISAEDAKRKYGVDCVGTCLEIEGFVYAITEQTPADSDIREVHKLIASGARLGFSLQGGPVKRTPYRGKDGKVYSLAMPSFVNKVAITSQPINMNTVCVSFAKSLAALFGAAQDTTPLPDTEMVPLTEGETLLLLGDNSLFKDMGASAGSSGEGLGSSGTQALVGSEGGDATRMGTSAGDETQVCAHCAGTIKEKSNHCPHCGAVSPWLKKSLDAAFAPFFTPAPPSTPVESMQDALARLCGLFA